MPPIIVDSKFEDMEMLTKALAEVDLLAVDCEGVDLGAFDGKLTLVSLAIAETEPATFLFDVQDLDRDAPALALLKTVLESEAATKIIHDCKADSKALLIDCGISLRNVHDTSAWQRVLAGGRKLESLNVALESSGLATNPVRSREVYKKNPAFWAKRPLDEQMLEWASEDVRHLFALREVQMERARSATTDRADECAGESARNLVAFRDAKCAKVDIHPSRVGPMIGTGGANLHALENRTGAFVQVTNDGQRSPFATVHGESEAVVQAAVAALQKFKIQHNRRSNIFD